MRNPDPLRRDVAEAVDDPTRHAALFNAFPSLVWIADARGACSFVNQAWEDYTGRHVEQERGDRWLESVHPEDRAGLQRTWGEALGLRRGFEAEYRLRRADGQHGWIHHSAVPVSDEGGRLAGFLGTCHDITERRAAELDARAKERTIRLLADNVPALIAYYDGPTLECRFANTAYARMWGWTPESILGKTVPEVIGSHHIRTRGSNDFVFLDLHIWMDADMPLDRAHSISHAVKDRLMTRFPQIKDAIIHIEPPPKQ